MADDLEGKIQIQSDLVPDNDNPRQPTTSVQYVTGADQNFETVDQFVAFHPNKMRKGMTARIVNIDLVSNRVFINEYTLMVDPSTLLDSNKDSIVTIDNYLKFWTLSNQTQTQGDRVFEYSPDGPNGTKPPYPYVDTPSFESNWHSIATPSDKWVRFRDSDDAIVVSGVKIFTGWTLPISIGQQNIAGDYVDTRYLRQDVDTTIRTSITGLVNGRFYLILTGTITESFTGGSNTYTNGRTFKYVSANTYSFSGDGTVIETVETPPRKINGLDNNEPIGWSDGPPIGGEQLWSIKAPKSVYGDLKGDWVLSKINENPDLIRYSQFASPNPNNLVGVNDPATTGSQGDIDLNAAGWLSEFKEDFLFVAERHTTGTTPAYTEWEIRKISGESGEYKDRVFKLFDINADFDDVATQKPLGSDAIAEGFSDTPLQESNTQINWVFEATKFFDGTLKGSWSDGVPYTGQDIFNDVISSDGGDNFKYNPNSNTPNDPFPSQLTLTADLYKGIVRTSETSEVTYLWERIYNNGAIDSTVISSFDSSLALYLLAASGTPGDPGYMRDGQRMVVKPGGVSGKAIFRCTQTFVITGGDNIVFQELITINDVTDGLDAKDLSIKADNQLIIYDNVNDEFSPAVVNLNAFFSNIVDPIIFWYEFIGGVWVRLDADSSLAPTYVITETPFGSRLTISCTDLFDHDDDLQEFRYAASTDSSNPESADNVVTFSDFVTISKAAAAAVGTPGQNSTVGILSNEYQNIILDDETLVPMAGEIGATGKAQTILSVFDGITNIAYGVGANKFTISLASDDVNVTFLSNTTGLTNDVRVYVSAWAGSTRKAVCTITINYNNGSTNIIFIKKFTVGSTLDTPGALSVIIDSDAGYEFTPNDRTTAKHLTAQVYDSSKVPQLQSAANWYFNWTVGGTTDPSYVKGGGPTNGEKKTVTRAQILISGFVTVRIAKVASPGVNDIVRSVSLRINDVADGKLYRLFSAATSAPAKPGSSVGPSGNGTWSPALSNPVWAVDGYENYGTNPSTYTWSNPYKIAGEKGDQGNSGGTSFTMYLSSGGDPNTTPGFGGSGNLSSISQMVAAGWRSSTPGQLPTSGYIWTTQRLYKTLNASGNPLTFDANGYPVNEVVFDSNSVWNAPQRITPVPGQNGSNGSQGPQGPQGPQGAVGPQGPPGTGQLLVNSAAGGSGSFSTAVYQFVADGSNINFSTAGGYHLIHFYGLFNATSGPFVGGCDLLILDGSGNILNSVGGGTIYASRTDVNVAGAYPSQMTGVVYINPGSYNARVRFYGRGQFSLQGSRIHIIKL